MAELDDLIEILRKELKIYTDECEFWEKTEIDRKHNYIFAANEHVLPQDMAKLRDLVTDAAENWEIWNDKALNIQRQIGLLEEQRDDSYGDAVTKWLEKPTNNV